MSGRNIAGARIIEMASGYLVEPIDFKLEYFFLLFHGEQFGS